MNTTKITEQWISNEFLHRKHRPRYSKNGKNGYCFTSEHPSGSFLAPTIDAQSTLSGVGKKRTPLQEENNLENKRWHTGMTMVPKTRPGKNRDPFFLVCTTSLIKRAWYRVTPTCDLKELMGNQDKQTLQVCGRGWYCEEEKWTHVTSSMRWEQRS